MAFEVSPSLFIFYYLFFIIFCFSASTDKGFSPLKVKVYGFFSCTYTSAGPQRFIARVHWPPMNRFACKPHGYIVYLEFKITSQEIYCLKLIFARNAFLFYISKYILNTSKQLSMQTLMDHVPANGWFLL